MEDCPDEIANVYPASTASAQLEEVVRGFEANGYEAKLETLEDGHKRISAIRVRCSCETGPSVLANPKQTAVVAPTEAVAAGPEPNTEPAAAATSVVLPTSKDQKPKRKYVRRPKPISVKSTHTADGEDKKVPVEEQASKKRRRSKKRAADKCPSGTKKSKSSDTDSSSSSSSSSSGSGSSGDEKKSE
jgi:hypothetical protein